MFEAVTEESDSHQHLQTIYKQRLLELFRDPLGTDTPAPSALHGWAKNRTCGDEVSFFSLLENDTVTHCWQDTAGCAISTATASLLVEALAGKSRTQCQEILDQIRELVYEGREIDLSDELKLLSAIHELPSRHECVGVALNAAAKSLEKPE